MKIRCISNSGRTLSQAALDLGNSNKTQFPIRVGDVFNVYGQHIYKGVLSYLIVGTYENLPSWYPVELFEVEESMFPLEWYYQFYGYDKLISSIWGYQELIYDEEHHDNLIEREDKAIRIFLKRKKEIDDFSNN